MAAILSTLAIGCNISASGKDLTDYANNPYCRAIGYAGYGTTAKKLAVTIRLTLGNFNNPTTWLELQSRHTVTC
jgi:hypothetical protein